MDSEQRAESGRKMGEEEKVSKERAHPAATLKDVARRVGLTPGTVSGVLNNSPKFGSVPQSTRERIHAAVCELNYHPNYLARALRVKRTYMIGVIAAEVGYTYGPVLISGIERNLRERGYFHLTVAHRRDNSLLDAYARLLQQQGVEGLITVDTCVTRPQQFPTVAIASHQAVEGVSRVLLDQRKAARLALEHLHALGHREIAFMKGPPASSDAGDRWECICGACHELGLTIRPELTLELAGDAGCAPQNAHGYIRELLGRGRRFTALFAYNDNTAIAAMRVMGEAGLRIPQDVSVVGFDDIQAATFTKPALTTIRQPLQKMGETAAAALVDRIEGRGEFMEEVSVDPEFVMRGSTGVAPAA
jgi:DNA-binding LacI/PurR family transcriptional regulator